MQWRLNIIFTFALVVLSICLWSLWSDYREHVQRLDRNYANATHQINDLYKKSGQERPRQLTHAEMDAIVRGSSLVE